MSQLQWIQIEAKCFFRNFIAVFFTLVFPPVLLFVFGEIYGNNPLPMFHGLGTVDACTPAYLCMNICVTGIMSLPLSLIGYREKKILKRFKASPVSPIQIIIAQVIVNLIMSILGSGLLIALAVLRYHISFEGDVVQVVFAYLISILSIFSIGFVIASVINNARAATSVSNIVYLPMLFLSGATIPIEIMPESITSISKFIPLSYCVNIMKATWQGDSLANYGKDILILLSISIVCIIVSVSCFRWEPDRV